MRKNNYELGKVNIDNFRDNIIIVRNVMSYLSERFGFDINLVVNDLLEYDFKCGNKVKINIQKQLIKNADNTISVIDFDGYTYKYLLSGDYYLTPFQKGYVLKEEIVNSVTTYKIIKPDGSYEVFDSDGKIVACYDKNSNLIYGYTYTSTLLSTFYVNDGSVGINFTYYNGKISSVDTLDNKNLLQMSYNNGVTATIGNVIYQINSSNNFEVLTKTEDNIIKNRLTKELVDNAIRIKEYCNEILTSDISINNTAILNLNEIDEVYSVVTDNIKNIKNMYKFNSTGNLICQYEIFDNMFSETFNIGSRYYKGDVLVNDDMFKGTIKSAPLLYPISTSTLSKKMFNYFTVAQERCSFLFSMWIKGYSEVNVKLTCDGYVGGEVNLTFVGKTEEWNFVSQLVEFIPQQTINNGFVTVNIISPIQNGEVVIDDVRISQFNPRLINCEYLIEMNGTQYNVNNLDIEFQTNNTLITGVNYRDILDSMNRFIYNNSLSYVFSCDQTKVYGAESIVVKVGNNLCDIGNIVLIERTTNGEVTKEVKRNIEANKLVVRTTYSNTTMVEKSEYNKDTKVLTITKDGYKETYNLNNYDLMSTHSIGTTKFLQETLNYDSPYSNLVRKNTIDNISYDYEYDDFGRMIKLKTASNSYLLENTFSDGNLTKLSINDNDITYGYTGDLLTSVSKADITYTYQYDSKNRIVKIFENGYLLVEYVYVDSINNLQSENLLDRSIVSSISKRVYTSDTNYYEIKQSFDKYNKLVKVERIEDSTTTILATYTYESKVVENLNDEVRYCATSPLVKETNGTKTYRYEYDNQNLRKVYKGSQMTPTLDYEYDKFGRIKKVTKDGVNKDEIIYKYPETPDDIVEKITHFKNNVEKGQVSYLYDNYGRVISKTIVYGNVTHKYEYYYLDIGYLRTTNKMNKVVETINGTIKTTELEYDEQHNITSIKENNVLKGRYYYDSHNRLERVDKGSISNVYTYDNNGNILSKKTYSLNEDGSLSTLTKTINYGYGSTRKNQLISYNGTSIQTDYLGAPGVINGFSASYKNGKLVDLYKTGTLKQSTRYEYTYNEEGLRTKKTYTYFPGKYALISYERSKITEYTYNNNRLEKEEMTVLLNDGSDSIITYIYNYIGDELVGLTFTKDSQTKEYYYGKNIFGDIIKIYNSNNEIVGSYTYDEYGNCSVSGSTDDSIAFWNHIRYRGYYYDVETGLYWVSTRYYSPELCRWISPDSIEYLDPESINGLNLYAYCENDPINKYDPTGHFAISLTTIGLIVGAVIGATAGGIVAYNVAKDNGAEGWELFGWTMAGIVGGGILGGTIGAGLGAFAGMSFSATIPTGFAMVQTSAGTMALMSTGSMTLTVTGAQILDVAGLLGFTYMFTKTLVDEGGVRITHNYPDDHGSPVHVHVSSDSGMTRVGPNGYPLNGDRILSPTENKIFWRNIKKIRKVIKKIQKIIRRLPW